MSLIAELKRRNVFKVGIAYLIVAWLVIQVASTIAPQLNLPDWAPRLITLMMLLGFPVALVLAWVFEMTPEGIKLETAPVGNKRFFTVAAVLAALAVGWFIRGGLGGEPTAGSFDAPLGAQSTAVLPFVNMSSDKENEYFSDGLTETLLNKLAQVNQLKVAARTSSFAFKGKQEDIRDIGRQLGVATVVEGSVQRAGDTLRITAQLVRTADGSHIWSSNYDRKTADLFAIQDEIAGAVTQALVGALVPEAKAAIAKGGTKDLAAYDLYTRGLAQARITSFASLDAGEHLFKQALERDPHYVDAMLALAQTWSAMAGTGSITQAAWRERVPPLLDRIEAEDPGNAKLLALRGDVAFAESQQEVADALYERALAAAPDDADILLGRVRSMRWTDGNMPKILELLQRAEALDRLNTRIRFPLTAALLRAKRYADAERESRESIRIAPESPQGYQQLGEVYHAQGDLAGYFVGYRRSQPFDPGDHELAAELGLTLDQLGDRADADRWLAKSEALLPGNFYAASYRVLIAGERGEAQQAFDGALPLIARHDESRRGNWSLAIEEGCRAAVVLGKQAQFRAALVKARLIPDGFTADAFKTVTTPTLDGPHLLAHLFSVAPCTLPQGAAGAAARAALLSAAPGILGADWQKQEQYAGWAAYLADDHAAIAKQFVKDPEILRLWQQEAEARWLGIADDPQVKAYFTRQHGMLDQQEAKLPQLLADAGLQAAP